MCHSRLLVSLSVIFLLILSGCQTHKKNQEEFSKLKHLQYWELKARVAIKANNKQSFSATLNWKQSVQDLDFHVYGLLGATYAHLTQNDQLATLQLQKQEIITASNAQQLLDQHLNWYFPINALSSWVKGISYGHPQEKVSKNMKGQIESIEFNGWSVQFSQFKPYSDEPMPRIIKASHNDYGTIKIVVKKWYFLNKPFDVSA